MRASWAHSRDLEKPQYNRTCRSSHAQKEQWGRLQLGQLTRMQHLGVGCVLLPGGRLRFCYVTSCRGMVRNEPQVLYTQGRLGIKEAQRDQSHPDVGYTNPA
jgi:hypothetical protein